MRVCPFYTQGCLYTTTVSLCREYDPEPGLGSGILRDLALRDR